MSFDSGWLGAATAAAQFIDNSTDDVRCNENMRQSDHGRADEHRQLGVSLWLFNRPILAKN